MDRLCINCKYYKQSIWRALAGHSRHCCTHRLKHYSGHFWYRDYVTGKETSKPKAFLMDAYDARMSYCRGEKWENKHVEDH